MKPEIRAKARASRKANQAVYARQVLRIDDHWTIRRADELNWEVQDRGKFHGFYSNIVSALQALPAKMLNNLPLEGENALALIIHTQKDIRRTIAAALPEARKLGCEKSC